MASESGVKSILSNPVAIASKPPVIFKFASAVLSLVIYSCISAATYDNQCLYAKYKGVCRFGSLSLITFMACTGLLALEIVFSHISSLKVRRRIAIADVIISGVSTIFYLLLFVFLAIGWLKSEYPPFGISINCCRIAILLSFLAIFALAACTGLAYVRYQSGADMTAQFITEEELARQQAQYYDDSGNYQQPGGAVDYSADPNAQYYSSGAYMGQDNGLNQ